MELYIAIPAIIASLVVGIGGGIFFGIAYRKKIAENKPKSLLPTEKSRRKP